MLIYFMRQVQKANLEKLQRLQNRALRCIVGPNHGNLSTDQLHAELKLCKLATHRKQHLANFMFKISVVPCYVDNRNLITRECKKKLMVGIKPNIEKVKGSILYKGSILWNHLSIEHQSSHTYESFKFKTKKLILG